MSPTRTRPPTRPGGGGRRPGTPPPSRRPLFVLGAVVAAVVLALVVAVVAGGGDDPATETGLGPSAATSDGDAGDNGDPDDTDDLQRADATGIAASGTPLVPLPDSGPDPAVGQPMPTLTGTTLDGSSLTIPETGRPSLVVFVAHWCPHCQTEVPVVQDWVDEGGLPAGVDLVTVSTAVDPRRPNYPPADWLAAEGWTAPVLTDADDQAGAASAGLTAFPFFVAVDTEGRVVERVSGELSPAQLDEVVSAVDGGAT